ncbi:GntR family transcriptional regulator [Acetobacteraceae bacterium H6797]|nr:GntR family transcriptional regulator [Acetobacteraceae bacterium H6797]
MTSTDTATGPALLEEPFPIARQTLHEQVATRLRDMVTDGRLSPGQRINEVALGATLGVSRTPLREALKTLAGEGLVELVPARGAVVRSFTLKDVADGMEVLKVLEQTAGRRACAEASDAEIGRVLALHEAMRERYAVRDRLPYFKLNQAIHSAIVALSGNLTLIRMHEMLQAQMKRIRFIGHEGPEKWAAAMAEHEEMAEALRNRDGEALADVLGRHHDKGCTRIADSVSQQSSRAAV